MRSLQQKDLKNLHQVLKRYSLNKMIKVKKLQNQLLYPFSILLKIEIKHIKRAQIRI